jgi:hypothetical protein
MSVAMRLINCLHGIFADSSSTKKKAPAKNRGATSSRQRFYLVMSTILALEALVFTDSTQFMQPPFDS